MEKIHLVILSLTRAFTTAHAAEIKNWVIDGVKYITGTSWLKNPEVVLKQLDLKNRETIKFLVLPDDGMVSNQWVWDLAVASQHGDGAGANWSTFDEFGIIKLKPNGFELVYNGYTRIHEVIKLPKAKQK